MGAALLDHLVEQRYEVFKNLFSLAPDESAHYRSLRGVR
jgi:hypothetical protein